MRVWALIDGFNWYYAIRAAITAGICGPERKWLDYRAMVDGVVRKVVGPVPFDLEVRWYTALVRNDAQAADRHRWYQRALEATGVIPVMGNYKRKTVRCLASCRREFSMWEEKATDVNMAIDVVSGAVGDEYDELFLFSGDSDLAPALRRAKQLATHKRLHVVVPAWRSGMNGKQLHRELTQQADQLIRLNFADFGPELPEEVPLLNGKIVHRPIQWQ